MAKIVANYSDKCSQGIIIDFYCTHSLIKTKFRKFRVLLIIQCEGKFFEQYTG